MSAGRGHAPLHALLAAALLSCATTSPRSLPPIEPWGHVDFPCGDSLEAEAMRALGPPPPEHRRHSRFDPIELQDALVLESRERRMREDAASDLVQISLRSRRFHGVDSLPPLVEALRIAPFWARSHEEIARVFADRGAWWRAHAVARQGLRLDAASAPLWGTLARVYIHRRDDARATVALEHALALDPKSITVRENLALLYGRAGAFDRADSLLQAAPRDISPSVRAFVESRVALARGDAETARDLLARAARDPEAPAAVHIAWGNAELEAGNADVAMRAYERALAVEPEAPAALNGLAVARRVQGDLEGAAALLVRITRQAPADTIAQFNLAGVGLDLSRRASGARADSFAAIAEAAFGACIDAGYRSAESLDRRAHLRLRRGDAGGAEADARRLLAIPGQRSAGALLYARAALAAQAPHRAVQALAPEFEADRASADALGILAKAFFELRNPERAVPVLRRAHERNPRDWRIAMNLGVALSQSGDPAGAAAVLRPLAVAHPNEPDVLQNLAAALQRLGERSEADSLLRRAAVLRQR